MRCNHYDWQQSNLLPVRIPFAHLTRYMMGPLYSSSHLYCINKMLTLLHTLDNGGEIQAARNVVFHEQNIIDSCLLSSPCQVKRYIRVLTIQHTLLKRLTNTSGLSIVRGGRRSKNTLLQDVYTDEV